MNDFVKIAKKTLTVTCVINTVIITLLYVLGYITNTGGGTAWIPRFNIMWMVLGISFVLSAAELILQGKGNFTVKMLWHFLSCLAGFLLIFTVGGGYADSPAAIVIGTFLFIIAYLVVNVTRFAVTGKFKRKKEEEEEYDEVFKK